MKSNYVIHHCIACTPMNTTVNNTIILLMWCNESGIMIKVYKLSLESNPILGKEK